MTNFEDLVVGSLECPIDTVASIIGEDENVLDNWPALGRALGIPNTRIKEWKQDKLLNKITHSDLVWDILEQWVGMTGIRAKLALLIFVIEEECKADNVREPIRVIFNLPTTLHHTMTWDDLPTSMQARVIKTARELFPTLKLEILKPLLKGVLLHQLLKGIPDTLPLSLSYYVNRQLITRNIISLDIFQKFASHIFLVSGIERYQLSKLANGKSTDHSRNQIVRQSLTVKHMILDSPHHFDKICKLTTDPVHAFHFLDNKLKWLQSRGEISAVQECVDKSQKLINEEDFINHLDTNFSHPVCIVDSPGMGKSVLLAQIGRILTEKYPDRYVIFLTLSQIIRQIRDLEGIHILQQISRNSTFADNPISTELLLDGFDEVDTCDFDFAHELLRNIKTSCTSIRMWVTSRPHLLQELERSLGTLGFNIQPFHVDDQIRFLTSYWRPIDASIGTATEEKLAIFASHSLETLKSTMNSTDYDIAGVPLQCLLLAEVYQEDALVYAEAEQSALSSIQINSITKLYELLIERKLQKSGCTNIQALMEMHASLSIELFFAEQFTKNKDWFPSIEVEDILKVGLVQCVNRSTAPFFVHRTIAEYFAAWFVVNMLQKNIDSVWLADLILRDVLHSCINNTRQTEFWRKYRYTFYTISKDLDAHIGYRNFLYYEFSHEVISYFLDSMLANVRIIPTYFAQHMKNTTSLDLMQQLVWSCVTSDRLQILRFFKNINALENHIGSIFVEQLIYYANDRASLELFKLVLGLFEEHHRLDETVQSLTLTFACVRSEFSIVEFLISDKQLRLIVEQLNDRTRGLLHACVERTSWNGPSQIEERVQVIRMLIDINPAFLELTNKNGITALFRDNVHIRLKCELIKLGANPFAFKEDKDMSNFLDFKASVNPCISDDFHKLVKSIPENLFRRLVRGKFYGFNQTSLHYCVDNFDVLPETLNEFRKAGANFNSTNKYGYSVLAVAVMEGRCEDNIRKLIECGADVHSKKGWRRRSLLHLAVEPPHKFLTYNKNPGKPLPETVALLLEWIGLDVKDFTRKKPMDIAKETGTSSVQLLVKGLALWKEGGSKSAT